MEYLTEIGKQLLAQIMKYNVTLILLQIFIIALFSVIIQGLLKNIIKYIMPQKHKMYLVKKIIYPILILIQGGILGFFILTFNHTLAQIIVGCLISFWATNVYSIAVELLDRKYHLDIERDTIISLIPGPNWESYNLDKEDTAKETPKSKKKQTTKGDKKNV